MCIHAQPLLALGVWWVLCCTTLTLSVSIAVCCVSVYCISTSSSAKHGTRYALYAWCASACSTRCNVTGRRASRCLVACYLVVLLMTNHSTSSCVLAWMVHLRCAAPLGHLYLGLGMHSALRTALGCIEAMSCAFRSMSLGLRTACNAIAGHVLLAVLVDMTCSARRWTC